MPYLVIKSGGLTSSDRILWERKPRHAEKKKSDNKTELRESLTCLSRTLTARMRPVCILYAVAGCVVSGCVW
jgi:hypothetical protein